jgi:hypothetical protein
MSRFARVTSIDVLPLLAAALQKFRGEAASAVDDIESEVRHALEWIHHDRKEYWTQELHRAQEAVNQARLQLQQALTMRRIADRNPSCIDEKRALERAKRRLETAQKKFAAVRHFEGILDRAADDFRRSRTQFASFLDVEVSRAVVTLNGMSESLVTYITMKAPDEATSANPVAKEQKGPEEAVADGATIEGVASPTASTVPPVQPGEKGMGS